MAFRDLREYIARLDKEGEVQPIQKEVDWSLEVGAIIRRSYDLKAPAPFFQRLRGYPEGYRIFGGPIGSSNRPNRSYARLAMALGLNPDSAVTEIMEEYIRRKKNPIKPVLVSGGPCKENVHIGEEVNLEEFPAPLLHEHDGGRYLGTWHLVATRDPDTGWVNWGMYRLMLHDRKTLGVLVVPSQHIGLHYRKYEAMNRRMECAVAIGTEPVTALMAGTPLDPGVNEADVVGSLRGEPLELVRCETVDLAVPATAEIVIEGEIPPRERRDEGPFGEYTGYMAGEREPRPVIHVKAVTHRHRPILTVTCPGVPVDENHVLRTIVCASLLDELRSRGFPVKMVYGPPEVGNLFWVISTKVPFSGYARHLACALWGLTAGRRAHYLIIVEEDVDITSINEVMWALTTRCHPDRGIFKLPNSAGNPLLPFTNSHEKQHSLGAHVLFDCTWPKEWPQEAVPVKASFDVLWPKDVQERVVRNWGEYGYGV